MNHLALPLSVICALVWAWIVAPLTLRVFGLRVPISWRERRDPLLKLGLIKYVLSFGVMTGGMASFVFFMANAFLEWRFSEAWATGFVPAPFNSGRSVLLILATWVLAGVVFGLLGWNTTSNTPVNRE